MIFTSIKSRILFETASFFLVFVVLFGSTSATAIASAAPQWAAFPLQSAAQQDAESLCALYPITLHVSHVADATPGDELADIFSGAQPGNFGWLSWYGDSSSPALAEALTAPGNSGTYVNPFDPADHVVSIGDSVEGFPSISNSAAVGDALDDLKGEVITVPIWDTSLEQGNNTVYHIVRFAVVELTGYQLPGENRISAIFHAFARCEPPTATDDFYDVAANDSLQVSVPGVLGNDTDSEGDVLTAALVSDSSNGVLVLNEDGSFDYTPDPGFYGADSFTYNANDGRLDSNIATVVITVAPALSAAVPDVVGLVQSDAQTAIVDVGLTVGTIGLASSETVPVGHVISQSPVAGTLVALGSAIHFVVSLGPVAVPITPADQHTDCSNATPGIATMWPPNHRFMTVNIPGISDPNGGLAVITIDGIFQDEPVNARGSGNTRPDAMGVGTATAKVRAERSGRGNGRVYHIEYTAEFRDGSSCSGTILVGVPHDRGKKGSVPLDGGALYDSTAQ